jgi:hypothetical protein
VGNTSIQGRTLLCQAAYNAVNSSSRSSSREPGADDESYASSNGRDGRGGSSFNDDVPFYEAKAEMARTTRRIDGEAGG